MFYFLYWLSAGLLFSGTVGYPLLLWVLVKIKGRSVAKGLAVLPKVSIVLPCYNEEIYIAAKINNLLALDYPADQLEIVLVSDGSTDRTDPIIDLFLPHPQITFISLPERSGKPSALNAGVAAAAGQILVFSDTRQLFNPEAITELVLNFGDEHVGGVSGTLFDFTQEEEKAKKSKTKRSRLVSFFRNYENKVKALESQVHSVVGVYGALYAIRKSLYRPLPPTIILDDMVIPFMVIQKGYRVVFEPKARASEDTKATPEIEVSRRQRIFTGNFQLLFGKKDFVTFRNNPILLQLFLHKFVRLFFPVLLFLFFFSNLFTASGLIFYYYMLLGQLLFYGICLFSLVFKKPPIFYLFSLINISVLQGLYIYISRSYSVKWQKHG